MRFYDDLYISESLIKKKNKIIWKLKHNVLVPRLSLVLLSSNGKDNFKIIPSYLFLQKSYPRDMELILGIAKTEDEAIKLMQQMVEDALKTNSPEDIRSYFTKDTI